MKNVFLLNVFKNTHEHMNAHTRALEELCDVYLH